MVTIRNMNSLVVSIVLVSCISISIIIGIIVVNRGLKVQPTEIKLTEIKQTEIKLTETKPLTKPKRNNMDIICNVLDDPTQKIQCIDPENQNDKPTYITITEGDIIKIGKSLEKTRVNFYLIMPYVFAVDYAVNLGKKQIVINTLDDLLKSFKTVEADYNSSNTIADKCLNVPNATRSKSAPPYNTTCLFFDTGFSNITGLTTTLERAILPFIPTVVQSEYLDLLVAKIKGENSLTIFEYIMYLAMINVNKSKQYSYVAQCQSLIDPNDNSSKSLNYIDC